MWHSKLTHKAVSLLKEMVRVYLTLVKVMLPAVIIVKLLELAGATELLAYIISPAMELVGLPQELGIVWAVALLTNIYTAMVVFYNIAINSSISVADISILGSMILIAHALPVEGAIAKALGIKWRSTIMIRAGGALLYGFLLNIFYSLTQWGQAEIQLLWRPEAYSGSGFVGWCIEQIQLFISIFFILAALMLTLRMLRLLGIEALLHKILSPLLRGLTLGKEAANITIIGMTLGISYGAGLLIDEVKQGHITKRDTFLVMGFLGICHSVIEDTLLFVLLGADINVVLWGRLLFAIVAIAIWGRLYRQPGQIPSPSQKS